MLGDPDKREEYDRYGSKSSGGGRGGGRGGMEDDLFESMFGGMGGMGSGRRQPPSQRRKEQASPSVVHLNVSLEDLYNGKEKKLEVARTRTCGTCKGCVPSFSPMLLTLLTQLLHTLKDLEPRSVVL